jgi:release factor glutamine methyltransferase
MSFTIKQILQNSKIDRLDTQVLLQHILNCSRTDLIIKDNYQLSGGEYHDYVKCYEQRLSGVPVAYIVGYKEFYSRLFTVSRDTLIPRPETELLVDRVLDNVKNGNRVLDLGTGSGAIAISLKLENPTLDITATDKYAKTLDVARENATNLGAYIKFIQSDWFGKISETYDIIVSNPPYIRVNDVHLNNLAFEPDVALTDFADGMSAIRTIIYSSRAYLTGYLFIEHGYDQGVSTANCMIEAGYKNVRTIKDYANLDRLTIGEMG